MSFPFDATTPYASARLPVFARNIVATSHPLAAQVGLRVLGQGGNAVDAAVAAAGAMTVLEPCSNGLGSDAFCILWDGERLHGLVATALEPLEQRGVLPGAPHRLVGGGVVAAEPGGARLVEQDAAARHIASRMHRLAQMALQVLYELDVDLAPA